MAACARSQRHPQTSTMPREFASLPEWFTYYHRRSHVCKTGVGDALIGAAGVIADYNGVPKVSYIQGKPVEVNRLNETIFGCGASFSFMAQPMKSGVCLNDDMLAQVCRHNVTRYPYEIARRARDIAGGLLVTLPSERDLKDPEIGRLLRKYLVGRKGVNVENRTRILRLIENMTMGRNAVGYLSGSMHGAGSTQAQRIRIQRQMQLTYKKLVGMDERGSPRKLRLFQDHFWRVTNMPDSTGMPRISGKTSIAYGMFCSAACPSLWPANREQTRDLPVIAPTFRPGCRPR